MTAVDPIGDPALAQTATLEVRHLSKTFGGVQALVDVSLSLRRGEVHGLLGENGSGKSTLIKILAGYHVPDPGGELIVGGASVKFPLESGQFRQLGLSFVHQDLGLIPSLTVLDNFLIGDLAAMESRRRISWRRERIRVREVFRRFEIDIELDAAVADLDPLNRAFLAIVRGFEDLRVGPSHGRDAGVLVLDEPTVFLPRQGIDQLFALIRGIAAQGAAVLFVSHDLDEVRQITDRVTVLRDGRVHGTVVTAETSEAGLVEMITGRNVERVRSDATVVHGESHRVTVSDVTGRFVRDLSFHIGEGEVVGVTGLPGSGAEELPYLLFGAGTVRSGQLLMDGHSLDLRHLTPDTGVSLGLALVPADRIEDASYGSLPVVDNVMVLRLSDFFDILLRRRRMLVECTELIGGFDVRPAEPRLLFSALSGGNQQKALLAKWLQMGPRVLLLHEPTQGVDVGARARIFKMVRDAAATGTSVLCASTDYDELAAISDRVLVLSRGRIVAELHGRNLSKDHIAERVYDSAGSVDQLSGRV